MLTPFVPAELVGEDRIEQLVLEEVKGDRKEIIEIDDLIVNYGFVFSARLKTGALTSRKIPSSSKARWKRILKASLPPEISRTYEGKVKLIASGFGEAPTAVNNAKAYMDPKARVQPLHSTSMFENNIKESVSYRHRLFLFKHPNIIHDGSDNERNDKR